MKWYWKKNMQTLTLTHASKRKQEWNVSHSFIEIYIQILIRCIFLNFLKKPTTPTTTKIAYRLFPSTLLNQINGLYRQIIMGLSWNIVCVAHKWKKELWKKQTIYTSKFFPDKQKEGERKKWRRKLKLQIKLTNSRAVCEKYEWIEIGLQNEYKHTHTQNTYTETHKHCCIWQKNKNWKFKNGSNKLTF